MDVILEKLTSINEAKELIETSVNGEYKSKIKNLTKLYMSEHSPMYSQIFKIKLIGIPYFVHTHIRTHKSHFIVETVTTNREDRGGDINCNRYTPVDMIIICNAKTIVNMCLKRLCSKASPETREVFKIMKEKMKDLDPDLVRFMVPQCMYRCGLCTEWDCCGYNKSDKFKSEFKEYIEGFENQYSFKSNLED